MGERTFLKGVIIGLYKAICIFQMHNQQGPAGQHRELCSILCNNLMVPRGKDRGRNS